MKYANLAIRGMRTKEIRVGQLDDALAMKPDLLSIFGGVNDLIAGPCDFDSMRADNVIIFDQARRITVLTFSMPDPTAINHLAGIGRIGPPSSTASSEWSEAAVDRLDALLGGGSKDSDIQLNTRTLR